VLLLILGVFLILLLFKNDNQIVHVSRPKVILNNIEDRQDSIRERETIIKYNEEDVARLNKSVSNLQLELAKFKRIKDTIQIIRTQDNLIDTLVYQGQEKDSIISDLKLNVADLKYVSNSKDTLLSIAKVDLKKVKRQRNILGLALIGVTTIAIIK
jgi:hypothetical protein